jgi:hypothetical protein
VGITAVLVAGVPAAPVATPVVVLGNAAAPAAGNVVVPTGVVVWDVGGNCEVLPVDASEPQPRFEASAWKAKKVATNEENFIESQARVEWL